MPTLKELQDAVANATSSKLNAQTAYNNAQSAMSNYYNAYMVNCKYKWAIPGLGEIWSQTGCDGGVNANQHPGCGSQQTCKDRVTEYNGLVNNTNTALGDLNTANANLNTAQTALTNYVATDPNAINQQAEIDANKARMRTLGIIIIVAAVVAISVFAYIFLKKKGYIK